MICVAFENAIDGMRMRAMPLRAAKDDIKSMGVVGVKWIVDASIDDFPQTHWNVQASFNILQLIQDFVINT